jgi:alkanesulfonate monooxygenase SsuD/methylene tetrahydromethanopterin reductase-like flavin-dependent oxidoreductase (luciferase family)
MFIPGMEPHKVKSTADGMRKLAAEQGRNPSHIKIIAGILIIVDETDEKAQAKYEDYLSYADLEGALNLFGGWTGVDLDKWGYDDDFKFSGPGAIQSMVATWSVTVPGTDGVKWTKKRIAQELSLGGPHARVIGSPKTVADFLQRWIDESGVDGFNISYVVNPGDFEDIVKWLLPELRARGVFWDDYVASTTRENYLGDGLGPKLRKDHPGAQYTWSADI